MFEMTGNSFQVRYGLKEVIFGCLLNWLIIPENEPAQARCESIWSLIASILNRTGQGHHTGYRVQEHAQ